MRMLKYGIVLISLSFPVSGLAIEHQVNDKQDNKITFNTIEQIKQEIKTEQNDDEIDFDALNRVIEYANAKEDAFKYAGFANIAWRMGKLDAAERLYKKSIELYSYIGDKQGLVQQHRNLAALYRAKGDNVRADSQERLAKDYEK